MLIYKFVGGAGVLLASLILYFETRKYQKKKAIQTEAYITLIEYIKNQVECYMLPIDRILSSCNKSLLKKCGSSDSAPAKTMAEIIEGADLYIDQDCIDLLIKFSDEFGISYREDQIRSCEYYRAELVKRRDMIKEKDAKDRKVSLALCLCISLSVIFILI